MALDDRLDSIDRKIDKLTEAMTGMVRFEEKVATQHEALSRFGFRMDDIEKRVEEVEKRIPVYDMWTGWASKIGMVVATAIVMALLGLVFIPYH